MTGNVQAVSQVGTTVADKYRLIRVLGIGGMGVVYEAQHSVTHRRVALKMMHGWVAESSPQAATRFLREAQAAASIGHPAIVDVLDAGQLPDGSLYLVFEMLDGVDLENALAAGELRAEDIVAIAIDVLEGLDAAHSRGFVHRDIKPANVFLSKNHAGDRQVKVLDFGIAKRVDSAASFSGITAHGSIVGTLEYMSPEQASAQTVDARTDLWALGALIFRALAGRAPFIGSTQLELVKAILCAPVPSLADARPDLPRLLVSVVDRALTRDREKRWSDAAAMRDALVSIDRQELPQDLPRVSESSGWTPQLEAAREAATPKDQAFEDFAANEPTRRAAMPKISISQSKVPVITEEPTKVSHERDVATVRVRDPDVQPVVLPVGQILEAGSDKVAINFQRVPVVEIVPADDVQTGPIPTEPIDGGYTGGPITQILLDQSLQDEALVARSKGGRWTLASLAFCTALAASAWVLLSDRPAESEPSAVLVKTILPAEDPPPPPPPPPLEHVSAPVEVAPLETIPVEATAVETTPVERVEKRERKKSKVKRPNKKPAERSVPDRPVPEKPVEKTPPPEPVKDDTPYYKENKL